MCIAQSEIAREEDTRACESNSQTNDRSDALALAAFQCDETNLPWIIFRAAHRASHIAALKPRQRAVLSALARTVDAARPLASIYARRGLLAERAMLSTRTVERALNELEEVALIERDEQGRYGQGGLYGRVYLRLTKAAATVLGLVASADEAPPKAVHAQDSKQSEQQSATGQTPSFTPCDNLSVRAIYKDLLPKTQKRQPGALPVDLQRLLSLGFVKNYVFKLMKTASTHGKRLSDIVEVCWPHLQKAKHPISYLNALIAGSKDFSVEARLHRDSEQSAAAEKLEAERIEQRRAAIAGRTFFSRDGAIRYSISSDGSMLVEDRVADTHTRSTSAGWARAFVEALDDGHVRAATDELDAAFGDARAEIALRPAVRSSVAPQDLPAREVTATVSAHLGGINALLRAKGFAVARHATIAK